MKYNPEKHHRRSVRLKGYDYSQLGAYFVTIVAQNRECLFGEIIENEIVINEYGEIVKTEWLRSSEIRAEIELDEYQVMPNHFHGIVFIVGANGRSPLRDDSSRSSKQTNSRPQMKPKSLSSLMAGFQSSVTSKINQLRGTPGSRLWQRNYYDHIVRNENELNRIREYIINNPRKWDSDTENPGSLS